MSKLSRQRAKERFLKLVDSVDKSVILEEIRNSKGCDDLYTYFVTKNAFASTVLDDREINEFLLKTYSDWYFLHKNTKKPDSDNKLLNEYAYAPVNLTGSKALDLIKNGEFNDILPITFQYINRLEESYFICIKTDELYNREFKGLQYDVRLYINLKGDKIIDFAKEFLDKAYLNEFPAVLKILNSDNRCDDVIIYTDYEYAEEVVNAINEIKRETSSIFANVGEVSPLLGSIDDYIGFGEQLKNNATYFASRCKALSSMQNMAGSELLKKGIIREEEKIIFRNDGNKYTATEYLEFLIEKNMVKLVEKKIDELESNGDDDTEELNKLYAMREDVSQYADVRTEVNKLKKAMTRSENYTLEMEGIGTDDYDYLAKLYRLFTSADTRILKSHSVTQKKDIVSKQLFKTTDTFEGVDTREFLDTYFKAKLALVVRDVLERDLESVKRSRQSAVLINIRKKACAKLRSILTSITDDGDEGKEYIGRCVNDYVRILSTDALEGVEVTIDGRDISLNTDVNTDIINMLPALKEEVDKLSLDDNFIDNILSEFDINKDNICLNKSTKNISKENIAESKQERSYYYDPNGYLSPEA